MSSAHVSRSAVSLRAIDTYRRQATAHYYYYQLPTTYYLPPTTYYCAPVGRLLRTIGRHGRGPSQFTHPVGVGVSGQRLFVSEYSGCRLQVLSLEGGFLQAVRSPDSRCLAALGISGGRLSVSDSASRVHLFAIEHPNPPGGGGGGGGAAPAAAPAPTSAAAVAGPAVAVARAAAPADRTLSGAADGEEDSDERTKMVAERRARVELAAQAVDMRGVLAVLTQDDIHWLLPAAYADAASHPQFYQFPPPKHTPR